MRKVWKPTGKVFNEIGYSWKPTGRTFTIVGNRCPLTRITSTKVVPTKETSTKSVATPTQGILVYSMRPKATRSVGSSSKVKIVESKTSNSKEPKQSWGSNVSDVPSSSLNDCISLHNTPLVQIVQCELKSQRHFMGVIAKGFIDISVCVCVLVNRPSPSFYRSILAVLKKDQHSPLQSTYYAGKTPMPCEQYFYLLHMDLYGPMMIQSINGRKYILVIVDDYSRFTWVKFLRSKDEVLEFVIKFLKMIQIRLNATIRNIRTDNGIEFVNQTLKDYYEEVGISHQTTMARTPQQNGVVKRRNPLVEATCTMLIFSKA
ncbi:retrovirus-related pol polyprotein from transposon TNT 1-94 [Tanacetum coccineum]